MELMALAVLFLLPTYYLAKSKGYNALIVLVFGTVLSFGVPWIIYLIYDRLFIGLEIVFPVMALFVVWLLPRKDGAPGRSYLKITFPCPECHETVSFARRYEGTAKICPMCSEIITIPWDEFSPPEASIDRRKPDQTSGSVCFSSFGIGQSKLKNRSMTKVRLRVDKGQPRGTRPWEMDLKTRKPV